MSSLCVKKRTAANVGGANITGRLCEAVLHRKVGDRTQSCTPDALRNAENAHAHESAHLQRQGLLAKDDTANACSTTVASEWYDKD
jgi:hypothetical protein